MQGRIYPSFLISSTCTDTVIRIHPIDGNDSVCTQMIMPRPKLPKTKVKGSVIQIRVNAGMKRKLAAEAEKKGLPLSLWLLTLGLAQVETNAEGQVAVKVPGKKSTKKR